MNIKINKRARLLYLLLACFLLFGFLFLPFQRNIVSADEVVPVPESGDTCNYLYDLGRVSLFVGSLGNVQIDLDYPKPIYPSTLQDIYNYGLGSYFNKRTYGYYRNNSYLETSPSFDIMFGAGLDNISPSTNLSLFANTSMGDYYNVDLFKSNSYIPLSNSNVSYLRLEFNDFLIPITNNTSKFRPFSIYLIGDSDFEIHSYSTYRYLYNSRSLDSASAGTLSLSDIQTIEQWNDNRSDFIESATGFEVYDFDNYYLKAHGDFYYQCITDLNILIEVSSSNGTNLQQVSFTNYSYVLSNSGARFSLSNVLTDYGFIDLDDLDYTSWLGTAVGGFLDFEIFPGFSLTSLIAIIIAIPLVITLLRYFAGG